MRIALALALSPRLAGGALVFGISGGQYDPDPFGVRDGSSGTADSATSDSDGSRLATDAGSATDAGNANDAGDAGREASATDAAPIDAGPPPCGLVLDDLESGD